MAKKKMLEDYLADIQAKSVKQKGVDYRAFMQQLDGKEYRTIDQYTPKGAERRAQAYKWENQQRINNIDVTNSISPIDRAYAPMTYSGGYGYQDVMETNKFHEEYDKKYPNTKNPTRIIKEQFKPETKFTNEWDGKTSLGDKEQQIKNITNEYLSKYGYLSKDATDEEKFIYYKRYLQATNPELSDEEIERQYKASEGFYNFPVMGKVLGTAQKNLLPGGGGVSPLDFLARENALNRGNALTKTLTGIAGNTLALGMNPGAEMIAGSSLLNFSDDAIDNIAMKLAPKLVTSDKAAARIGTEALKGVLDGAIGELPEMLRRGDTDNLLQDLPSNMLQSAVGGAVLRGAKAGLGEVKAVGKDAIKNKLFNTDGIDDIENGKIELQGPAKGRYYWNNPKELPKAPRKLQGPMEGRLYTEPPKGTIIPKMNAEKVEDARIQEPIKLQPKSGIYRNYRTVPQKEALAEPVSKIDIRENLELPNGQKAIEGKQDNLPKLPGAKDNRLLEAPKVTGGPNLETGKIEVKLDDPKVETPKVEAKTEAPEVKAEGITVNKAGHNSKAFEVRDGKTLVNTLNSEEKAKRYAEIYEQVKKENPGVVKETYRTEKESEAFNNLRKEVNNRFFNNKQSEPEIPEPPAEKPKELGKNRVWNINEKHLEKADIKSYKAEGKDARVVKELVQQLNDEIDFIKEHNETGGVSKAALQNLAYFRNQLKEYEVKNETKEGYTEIKVKEAQSGKEVTAAKEVKAESGKEAASEIAVTKEELTPSRKVTNLRSNITNELIKYDEHYNAYRGVSMNPEKRARDSAAELKKNVNNVLDTLEKYAKTDAMKEVLAKEFPELQGRMVEAYRSYLSANSKTMSTMVTGPANFPVAKNEKAFEIARKRMSEYSDIVDKGTKAIIKKMNGTKTGEDLANEEAQRLINEVYSLYANMKTGQYDNTLLKKNLQDKIMRSARNGNFDAVQKTLEEVKKIQAENKVTIFAARNKVWSVVGEAKAQLEAKTKMAAENPQQTLGEYVDGKIIKNNEIDRIQLVFDKPIHRSSEVYKELKSSGWNYSPTNEAWQRKSTNAAEYSAKRIMDKYFEKAEVKAEAPKVETKVEAPKNEAKFEKLEVDPRIVELKNKGVDTAEIEKAYDTMNGIMQKNFDAGKLDRIEKNKSAFNKTVEDFINKNTKSDAEGGKYANEETHQRYKSTIDKAYEYVMSKKQTEVNKVEYDNLPEDIKTAMKPYNYGPKTPEVYQDVKSGEHIIKLDRGSFEAYYSISKDGEVSRGGIAKFKELEKNYKSNAATPEVKVGEEIKFSNNENKLGEEGIVTKVNEDGSLTVKQELPIGDVETTVKLNANGEYTEVKAETETKPPKGMRFLLGEDYEKELIKHLKDNDTELPRKTQERLRDIDKEIKELEEHPGKMDLSIDKLKKERKLVVEEYLLPTRDFSKLPEFTKAERGRSVTASQILKKNETSVVFNNKENGTFYGTGYWTIKEKYVSGAMKKAVEGASVKQENHGNMMDEMSRGRGKYKANQVSISKEGNYAKLSDGLHEIIVNNKYFKYFDQIGAKYEFDGPTKPIKVYDSNDEFMGCILPIRMVKKADGNENYNGPYKLPESFTSKVQNNGSVGAMKNPEMDVIKKPRGERKKFIPEAPKKSVLNGIKKKTFIQGDEANSRFKSVTVPRSENTSSRLREKLNQEPLTYTVKTDKEALEYADKVFTEKTDKEILNRILTTKEPGKEEATLGMKMISKLQASGKEEDLDLAVEIVRYISSKATNMGQYIQALSMYRKLSPEGMLRYAQKSVDAAVDKMRKKQPEKFKDIDKEIKDVQDIMNKVDDDVIDTVSKEAEGKIKDIVNKKGSKKAEASEEITPEDMMAQMLAGKVKGNLSGDVVKRIEFEKDIVKTLHNIAKSELPEKKTIPVDPFERVKLMLENKDIAKEVWNKAKDLLKEEYKDEPEKYAALQSWFNQEAKPIFLEKDMNISIKNQLGGIKIRDLVKQSADIQGNTVKNLAQSLIEKGGLEGENAKEISEYVQKRMNELMQESREKQLENLIKVKEKKKGEVKQFVDKIIEIGNLGGFTNEKYKAAIYEKYGIPSLSNKELKVITDKMAEAQKLKAGRKKDVIYAEIEKLIADKIPASLGEKARAYQRINLLLNTKTMTRNVLGNVTMIGLENIKDIPGALVDKAVSKITGKRTTMLPSLEGISTQYKGLIKGGKIAIDDAKRGIDTSKNASQYELPTSTAYKKIENPKGVMDRINNVLAGAEKVTNLGLRLGDEPFYRAAYDEYVRQQMKLTGSKIVTDEIKTNAEKFALDRTFQNVNNITKSMSKLQNALNLGKDFGLGNIVLPYTKTPANIMDKAVDYSPAGVIRGAIDVFYKRTHDAANFDQKAAVDKIGRGLTGTAAILVGYSLAKVGALNGSGADKKAANKLERQTGKLNYSIKVGDTYRTIDWMQPAAIPLMIGADIFQNQKSNDDVINILVDAVKTGSSTLFNQSLLSGLNKLFGGYSTTGGENLVEGISKTFLEAPGQAVPFMSALKQAAQLIDNTVRDTYGKNPVKTEVDKIISKIPGASRTLLPSIDTLGREKKQHNGSKGLKYAYDVLFNPGYDAKYNPSKAEEIALELYEATGETKHLPKEAENTIKYSTGIIPGTRKQQYETITLTKEQKNELQKIMGQETEKAFSKLGGEYNSLKTDIEKVDYLAKLLSEIKVKAEDQILKSLGKRRYKK